MHEPDQPSELSELNERSERSERSERGASAVEYGLLIAGIAAMIVVVIFAFGGGARGLFHGSCSDLYESTGVGSCQ